VTRYASVLIFSAILAHAQPQPATADEWQRLGLTRHLRNEFDAAIPAFREAVRLNPSLWTSHLFLGIGLYRTNQFQAALTSIEQANRLAPKEHAGRDDLDYWLAAARIARAQPLKGLQSLERLIARNQKQTDALELAVRTYADLSSSAWNDVAERYSQTAPGYEVHGYVLESEGNLAGALEAFRTAAKLSPERAGPGLAIGRLLLREKKTEEALSVLNRELTLPDPAFETYYFAGLAAIELSRFAEAAPWLQRAARWPGRNPEAPLALAQVHLALKEPAKAVPAARQAVQLAPTSEAAHDILATALAEAGLKEELEAEHQRWRRR
jgi:tetratricopeptide (TPR) repeat protein